MQTLIYASRQAIPPADLDHEVGEIIQTSIRNNRRASLTGLLLVHGGYFLQALEGPTPAVEATYLRIMTDPRHHETRVLARLQAADRSFGDWNMCARQVTAADKAIVETLNQRGAFEPYGFSGVAAMRLLTTVRDIQRRTQLKALA